MLVIYTGEEIPPAWEASIFLAGPSARPGTWRRKALQILARHRLPENTVIFVAEYRDGLRPANLPDEDRYKWEREALLASDVILAWVDRDIKKDIAHNQDVDWSTLGAILGAILLEMDS